MSTVSQREEATDRPNENAGSEFFSEEALHNILGFLGCLKDIQDRLFREGYRIKEDQFIPPDKNQNNYN